MTEVLPTLLSIVLVIVYFLRPMEILTASINKGQSYFGFLLITFASLAGPVIVVQYFIIHATGNLKVLDTPDELSKFPAALYIKFNRYQIDKKNIRYKIFDERVGKNLSLLNYTMRVAVPYYGPGALPVADSAERRGTGMLTLQGQTGAISGSGVTVPPAWVCYQYDTTISNNEDVANKEAARQAFIKAGFQRFWQKECNSFTYLRRPLESKPMDQYNRTIEPATNTFANEHLILEAVFEPYGHRYTRSLFWSIASIAGACIVMFIMVLASDFNQLGWEALKQHRSLKN